MRMLIAILIVLISVNSFAQTRKKSAQKPATRTAVKPTPKPMPKATPVEDGFAEEDLSAQPQAAPLAVVTATSRYPLHSRLYFTPNQKLTASGSVGLSFAGSTVETPLGGGITATDEYTTTAIITEIDLAYGVLPDFLLGMSLGYGTATTKNTSYKDNVPTVQPLEPDLKRSGLFDPQVYATYRPIDGGFVLDLTGALRLGILGAESGVAEDSVDVDTRADVASRGNFGSGSYAAELGAQAGVKLSNRLNLIGELKGEYNFEGSQTVKRPVNGDIEVDQDAYTEFSGRFDVEFAITPNFILDPYVEITLTPKTKQKFLSGAVTSNLETAAFKTYDVGVNGSYLLQTNFALKAGYSYNSLESAKLQRSNAGGAFFDVSNTKDRDAHSVLVGATYEF